MSNATVEKNSNKPIKKASNIWVLCDNRPGNNSQSLGVAKQFKQEFEVINVTYGDKVYCPNFLLGRSLTLLDPESKEKIKKILAETIKNKQVPQVIISAGRRLAPLSRWLYKKFKAKTKQRVALCHIMHPNTNFSDFSVVAIPAHDDNQPQQNNTITIYTSPHDIDDNELQKAQQKWEIFEQDYPKPHIGLLLGGASKHKPSFTIAEIAIISKQLNEIAQEKKGSILVSGSRRTNPEHIEIIKRTLNVPSYIYAYNNTEQDDSSNPYKAILAYSDYLVVTGDSISMCSEACYSNAQGVYIYANDSFTSSKARKMHQHLYDNNMAKPYNNELEKFQRNRSNSAITIANAIKKHTAIT